MTEDDDPYTGETFQSKDWRDANRRIFVSAKTTKVNRKGETVDAYLCHPTGPRGPDLDHHTTITPENLDTRWRKVSH